MLICFKNVSRLKNPNWRQTSSLLTKMTEQLNWGLARNNSSLVFRAKLETATTGLQVQRLNRSVTLPSLIKRF